MPPRNALWKKIGDVDLCEFDRLLLARAVDVHGGSIDGLAGELRGARENWETHRQGDWLLSQLADLRERLAVLRASPSDVVGSWPREGPSREPPLLQRIRREEITEAMWSRNLHLRLERRAIDADSDRFPVSPAPFARARIALANDPRFEPCMWEWCEALRDDEARTLAAASGPAEHLAIARGHLSSSLHFEVADGPASAGYEPAKHALDRYRGLDFRVTGIDPAFYWEDYLAIAIAFPGEVHSYSDLFADVRPDDLPALDLAFGALRGEIRRERERARHEEGVWANLYVRFVLALGLHDRLLDAARLPELDLRSAIRLADQAMDLENVSLAGAILEARPPHADDDASDLGELERTQEQIREWIACGHPPWVDENGEDI